MYICFVFPPTFGLKPPESTTLYSTANVTFVVSYTFFASILSSKIMLNAKSFPIICPRGGGISLLSRKQNYAHKMRPHTFLAANVIR